ncbi:MAG: PaaI family thioesterase [Ilumatobacteraceae bacterium]
MSLIRLHNDDWGYESNCFVCEARNERGLRIPFFHDTDHSVVTAELSLSADYSGAPTMVHGGVVLAVLDEAMAWACIAVARRWAVTTETTTRFERAVRVDKPYRIEARVVEQTDSEITTAAAVLDVRGQTRARATATFTILGEAAMKRIAGVEDLPDAVKLD